MNKSFWRGNFKKILIPTIFVFNLLIICMSKYLSSKSYVMLLHHYETYIILKIRIHTIQIWEIVALQLKRGMHPYSWHDISSLI